MSFNQFPSQLQNQPKINKISTDSLPFKIEKSDNTKIVYYQKKGHWTQKQKLKYSFFLTYFKEKFIIRSHRRNFKIFKVMADFVKTRSHNQCRSHHQKMEKQYNDLDTIITNVAQKYHPRAYQGFYQKYCPQIKNLNQFYFSAQGKKRIKKSYSSNIQQQNSKSISQKQFNCLIVDQKAFKFFTSQKQNQSEKKQEGKTKQNYGQNQVDNYEEQLNKPFYFQLPVKLSEIQKQSIIINQNVSISSAIEKLQQNAEIKDDYLEELQKNQIQKLMILQNYKMHSCLANYYQNEFWLCERKKTNILQFINNNNIEKNMRN